MECKRCNSSCDIVYRIKAMDVCYDCLTNNASTVVPVEVVEAAKQIKKDIDEWQTPSMTAIAKVVYHILSLTANGVGDHE